MLSAWCFAGQPCRLAALGAMAAAVQILFPATRALRQTGQLGERGGKLAQVASLHPSQSWLQVKWRAGGERARRTLGSGHQGGTTIEQEREEGSEPDDNKEESTGRKGPRGCLRACCSLPQERSYQQANRHRACRGRGFEESLRSCCAFIPTQTFLCGSSAIPLWTLGQFLTVTRSGALKALSCPVLLPLGAYFKKTLERYDRNVVYYNSPRPEGE